MATYRLGFYDFGELTVSVGTDQAGIPLPRPCGACFGTPGARFALAGAETILTSVLVVDHDSPAANGFAGTASVGAWIAASSGFGEEGQTVSLDSRLSVVSDEHPPREMSVDVLGLDGTTVGLLGAEPLRHGVTYTITRAITQNTIPALRRHCHSGGITEDSQSRAAEAWDAVFCFAFGTLVDTPEGPRPIEALQPGDLVTTLGNGSQPLRWVGSRYVPVSEMLLVPDLQPVEFAAGAIGNARPLRVSPQHRIFLNDWRAQVFFGEDEVLVPAKAMINGGSIRQILPAGGVTYIHLLFDRHEIVVSEGALSESFHPGEAGLSALDAAQRQELELLFPGLELLRRRAAYPIVKLSEARALRLPE